MHPQLTLHNNQMCADKIQALLQCHEEGGYWGRLTGRCNEQKRLLDLCFRAQKKVKRKAHLEEARASRERWLAACEREEQAAKSAN